MNVYIVKKQNYYGRILLKGVLGWFCLFGLGFSVVGLLAFFCLFCWGWWVC